MVDRNRETVELLISVRAEIVTADPPSLSYGATGDTDPPSLGYGATGDTDADKILIPGFNLSPSSNGDNVKRKSE